MLILKRNLIVGFMLCILIFSFVVPFLFGLREVPNTLTGRGDVVVITQKDQKSPLNSTLLDSLAASDDVVFISPEVIFPSIVSGEPILCRGVESRDILAMDSLVLDGEWLDTNTGILGREAARRLRIGIGDTVVVSSPNKPSFALVTISGIYHSDKPSDSLFISLEYARFLIGLSEGTYTMIRLTAENLGEVFNIVEASGTGIINIDLPPEPIVDNEEEQEEDDHVRQPDAIIRLGRRYVNFFSAGDSSGYTSTALQYGPQTVDMVVVGLLMMTVFLVVVGVTVLILRGIAEGRQDMGVLVAIGTPRSKIRLFFFRDIFFITAVAAPGGVMLGLVLSHLVSILFPVVAFGHTIAPASLSTTLWVLVAGCFIIPILAWFIGGESTTGEHPKTLFAPLEIETPSTPLEEALAGGDV